MITGGVYLDTIFKLIVAYLTYRFIDLKCQMAIITRVVFHYIAYLFILFRIIRVQNVNDIQKKLIDDKDFKKGAEVRLREKRKTYDGDPLQFSPDQKGAKSKVQDKKL